MPKRIAWLTMLMLPVFVLMQCDITDTEDNLITALKELINADEIIGIDGIDDQGAQDVQYDYGTLAKIAGDIYPANLRLVRFGRKLDAKPTREVEILATNDSIAIALVTTTATGQFKVVLMDTVSHTVADSVTKAFTEVAKQKIKLRRVRWTDRPRKDWRVVAASPIVARTVGNSIEISRISLIARNGNTTVLELVNDAEDSVLNHFLDRSVLIGMRPNGLYDLELALTNANPYPVAPGELVTVHYGVKRGVLKFRRPLQDPENDDVFSGVIGLHGYRTGMCRIFFDVIDYAAIFDEAAPFNATYWAVPYLIKN